MLDEASGEAIAQTARSLLEQPHRAWEIVLASPAHALDGYLSHLRAAGIEDSKVRTYQADLTAGIANALDGAARAARAEHLVLMDSPVIGLTYDWVRRLLGYSAQPGIGAAGPVVLAPDGRVEQAGVAVPLGFPLHLLHGMRTSVDRLFGFGTSVFNVSAVSGVLATARATFERLGGLRGEMCGVAMIDYCLRAQRDGLRTVTVPDARVQRAGGGPTINDFADLRRLREAWGDALADDPYYNPNYRQDRGDFLERPHI